MIEFPFSVTDDVVMRPLEESDAASLCRAYLRNRDHLRPWEPRRGEEFFTEQGQAERVAGQLEERDAGRMAPWVLVGGDEVVGAVTLSNVALGPFRSAHLGYWVDGRCVGRGLATAAVRAACRAADERLGLHRVEAGTVIANHASRRVLAKCGFSVIGTAREYLHIDGEWRDHVLFQRILNARSPV
ncbi:GNAT family N-acetyltransferase [Streptomyces sp. SID8352]|uniref:GNAT family N-acetyltransferase n=1 Tax=Streptomyces sp. SID8352 TaxID=2690338 RepID=UPI001926FB0D|nr:GNAT family N-acetyltransferase [Streptomyces sp. SID8352]